MVVVPNRVDAPTLAELNTRNSVTGSADCEESCFWPRA